jgi:hypothetical protein
MSLWKITDLANEFVPVLAGHPMSLPRTSGRSEISNAIASSAEMPAPESSTVISKCELTRSRRTSTLPFLAVNLKAFVSRFQLTCCRRVGSNEPAPHGDRLFSVAVCLSPQRSAAQRSQRYRRQSRVHTTERQVGHSLKRCGAFGIYTFIRGSLVNVFPRTIFASTASHLSKIEA